MLSTFSSLSVNSAKHLVANLEMRPYNDAARLLLRVSQDVRKYRDRDPHGVYTERSERAQGDTV